MRRLRDGEWIAAAGGIALLASMFLHWYGPARGAAGELTAWQALRALDVLIALAAVAALALLVLQATRESPSVPVAFSVLTMLAGALATLLVLYRIANPPGPDGALDVQTGAWAAAAAAAVTSAGGWRSLRTEAVPNLEQPPIHDLPAPAP